MLLSIPAGFCSAVTSVATRTVLLARAPEEAGGQILATQATISDAVALLPTLAAGLALDLVDVRVVAFTIALLLVIGAIAGRRIGADHRTSTAAVVGVQTAVGTSTTHPSGHES